MSIRFTSVGGLTRTANLPPWNAMTLCGWASRHADQNAYSGIACFDDAAGTNLGMLVFTSDGDTLSGYTPNNGESAISPAKTPANDVPFFWALVVSGTGASAWTLYYREALDGAFTTLSLQGAAASWTPATIRVGENMFTEWLDGSVEHVKCWDAALNSGELDSEFNSSVPVRTSNLNFYWPCTNTSNTNDASGNGRNPTIGASIVDGAALFPFGVPPFSEASYWPFGRRNARPGRGPYSRLWRKNRILRPVVEVPEQFPPVVPLRIKAEIGSNRPRVGRSPYSLGRFFRPKVEGFEVASVGGNNFSQPNAAALSFVGALQKTTIKAFAGGITPTAALTSSTARLAVLTAALSFVGTIVKQTNKNLAGGITPAGVVVKTTTKLHDAILTFNGLLSTGGAIYPQNLAAVLSFSGNLVKSTARSLIGSITPAGVVVKQTIRSVGGSVSFVGDLSRRTFKTFAGVLSFNGALTRSFTRLLALAAGLSFTGDLVKGIVILTNTVTDMWRKAWTSIWRDINQPKDGI